MDKIRVGIYGAAGYTAGELIRILINHPEVAICQLQSESQAGKAITSVHKDMIGEAEFSFVDSLNLEELDVLFLCKGHGDSKVFMKSVRIPASLKVVDLSNDFRLQADAECFIYGLPEVNRDLISAANKVANPGCFATAIQLGLLPAAKAGFLPSEVHTTGITGSTGAGQSLSLTSHFSWRNNNLSVYKAFTHQHLGEIGETIASLAGKSVHVNFIPIRGNFARGILVTSYFQTDLTQKEALEIYRKYYQDHPFTHVTDENPDLKMVVNTNKAVVYLEKQGANLLVISIIDNLLKGASGQAVQNMNLMFGLAETTGLQLKSIAF